MDNIKTNYKFEPRFQIALKDFLNNTDNIYYELDVKLSDKEKSKIQDIRNRNAK